MMQKLIEVQGKEIQNCIREFNTLFSIIEREIEWKISKHVIYLDNIINHHDIRITLQLLTTKYMLFSITHETYMQIH